MMLPQRKLPADVAENAAWFWSLVDQSGGPDSCWPWRGGANGRGYGSAQFVLCGRKAVFGAHVIAHVLGNGGSPSTRRDGTAVLHACDNPPCCNPRHLSIGSNSDNQQDSLRKGRRRHIEVARGEDVGLAKLTDRQVLDIRERWAGGETQDALAAEYSLARSAIFMVCRGKTWTHLPLTIRRVAPLRSDAWTVEQDDILRQHASLSDSALAERVSAAGPRRTARSVETRRLNLGRQK